MSNNEGHEQGVPWVEGHKGEGCRSEPETLQIIVSLVPIPVPRT